MTLLDGILNYGSIENPSTPLSEVDLSSPWGYLAGGQQASTGQTVSTDAALGFHAFYRGVDLVSSYVGKLPVHIEKKQNGGWVPAVDHPNYLMVLERPNSEMNALVHRKTGEGQRMYEGNAYVFCRRRGDGQILEFILLNPCQTWPVRTGGKLYYMTYKDDGTPQLLNRQDMMHLKNFSKDGLVGVPLKRVGRESLASGIALIEYGNRFFRNGALPLVVLEIPAGMNDTAKEDLAKNWNKIHGSLNQAHKTGVVTGGAKVNVLSAKAQESQLTEQKNFSLIEVSNLTGAPPHKLGEGSRQAYNSLEQENQSFLDDGLDWRLVDWEMEYENVILTEQQKRERTHRVRFDREQLVRADLTAKANYDSKSVAGLPWKTIDEVRVGNGLNPLPGSQGDKLIIPSKSSTPEQQQPDEPGETEPKKPEAPKVPADRQRRAADALQAHLAKSCRKMAKRIIAAAQNAAKKPAGFDAFIERLGEDHAKVCMEEFSSTLEALYAVSDIAIAPRDLASKLLKNASDDLVGISCSATARGLEGAVAEWSTRFIDQAAELAALPELPRPERSAA